MSTGDTNGAGELRTLLDSAADGDVIVFDATLTGMTITLTSTDSRTTGAGPAVPVGSTALVVDGGRTITIDATAAPGLVINGNDLRRIFVVSGATTVLELRNLTLTRGRAAGGAGGNGEDGSGGGGAAGLGGAIYVDGATVKMVGCLVTECSAVGGDGGLMSVVGFGSSSGGGGGGLDTAGADGMGDVGGSGGEPNGGAAGAAATGSGGGGGGANFAGEVGDAGDIGGGGGGGGGGGDGGFGGGGGGGLIGTGGVGGLFAGAGSAGPDGGGGAGLGGGVFLNGGALEATNCTFTSCLATRGNSAVNLGQGWGGAIFQRNGSLTLMHCTIARNTASTTAGGVGVVGDGATATVSIRNTIVSNSSTPGDDLAGTTNAGGTITDSGGGNVIMSQAGFSPVATVSTADPQVANSLASNVGDPTQTLSLLGTSPAINAADAAVRALAPPNGPGGVDQRGRARRVGFMDVGAFEAQVNAIVAQSGGGQSAQVNAAFADPIVLRADDANGNALAGAPLTLAPPATGATAAVSTTTPTTGAGGTVQVTATANATAGGPYTVNITSGSGAGSFLLTCSSRSGVPGTRRSPRPPRVGRRRPGREALAHHRLPAPAREPETARRGRRGAERSCT